MALVLFRYRRLLKKSYLLLISKFKEHIQHQFPFLHRKKLLVASSGGIDSMVLTDLLSKLDYQITLAHCNFHLRGKESDLDEAFVIQTAKSLEIPFYVISFDTKEYAKEKNISTQMAARELRYEWFEKLLQKYNLDYLLTAHHADDNLETFLINFSRGTGIEGLTGIPSINHKTIRPLLPFSRKEIEQYAKENKISWREDQSNSETKYLRNKLRHDIIPFFKELNPNFMASFANTLENLQGSKQIVKDRIKNLKDQITNEKNGSLKLDIQKLNSLSNPKAYLYELLKDYGFTEWDDVLSLLDAQSGKQVLSNTHRLLKDRECLIISPLNIDNNQLKSSVINDFVTNFNINDLHNRKNDLFLNIQQIDSSDYPIADFKKTTPDTVTIDKDLLNFPLIVRKWENGDYFYPLGLQGRKKVSKYFKDEKMSLLEKENIWLLCSDNKIVWIIGKRLDNRFKITSKSKNILKITIET